VTLVGNIAFFVRTNVAADSSRSKIETLMRQRLRRSLSLAKFVVVLLRHYIAATASPIIRLVLLFFAWTQHSDAVCDRVNGMSTARQRTLPG